MDPLLWLQAAAAIPIVVGSIFGLLTLVSVLWFMRRGGAPDYMPPLEWPAVTILKPVHGLEKNLAENLRSACRLDYPDYQVVMSVQRPGDPALPLLREIEAEFGSDRVTVVVTDSAQVVNGKIENLLGALKAARHDVLVISDSDVRLRPDYLKALVPPLLDPEVGCVCTLYRAVCAETWYEKFELLTLNAEFVVNLIFAKLTGASGFCLGASTALHRSTLEEIGGLEPLGEYLVEDFEMGRRIRERGHGFVLLPYFVDMMVDLKSPAQWWNHLVYWDQNTRAARPIGFFCTILIRPVPFALLFAALRFFDPLGLAVLAGTTLLRIATTAWALQRIDDSEGIRALGWLPARDIAGLGSWVAAVRRKTFVWRGLEFGLTPEGRIVPRETSL